MKNAATKNPVNVHLAYVALIGWGLLAASAALNWHFIQPAIGTSVEDSGNLALAAMQEQDRQAQAASDYAKEDAERREWNRMLMAPKAK